jgi:hypothetical protein
VDTGAFDPLGAVCAASNPGAANPRDNVQEAAIFTLNTDTADLFARDRLEVGEKE